MFKTTCLSSVKSCHQWFQLVHEDELHNVGGACCHCCYGKTPHLPNFEIVVRCCDWFYSNPICTAKLSQLILSVDSLDTRNTMLLDEEVQVDVANLLSSTSVLHNVSKFHMFITLGCNLFALQDTFPVFSSFLKVVCSTEIPQKLTCCHFHVPPDNII